MEGAWEHFLQKKHGTALILLGTVLSYGNAILELVRPSLETWKVQPWCKVGLKHICSTLTSHHNNGNLL